MSKPWFVFLEPDDLYIESFLQSLREIFNTRRYRNNVHITIQGPFSDMPSSELISELRRKTVQPNIIISGTKIFDENNLKIFALRCSSPLIKSIWNKPDFNDIDEIIPHISIFESAEDDKIQIVRRFFKENPIELFLNRVKVTLYQANSPYLSIFPKYPFNDELGKILNLPQNFIKDAIRIGEILKKN